MQLLHLSSPWFWPSPNYTGISTAKLAPEGARVLSMSTDYNYDEQVTDNVSLKITRWGTDTRSGSILPLLHPHHLRPCHPSPVILPPQARKRSELLPCIRPREMERKTDRTVRHRGYCPSNKVQFQACRRRSYSRTEKEAMAAREETEEDYHSGFRLPDNGVDVLFDHDYKDKRAKNLGPV